MLIKAVHCMCYLKKICYDFATIYIICKLSLYISINTVKNLVNVMIEHIQRAILPCLLLSSAVFVYGCDSGVQKFGENDENTVQSSSTNTDEQNTSESSENSPSELKSGNYFYIARDVADMQLKAGDYLGQLQEAQNQLKEAINLKDHQALQASASNLEQQLKGLETALNGLDLKSQEIDQIRKNILSINQQALSSPFLNGEVDLINADFKKIEQQMGSIQNEMFKLVTLFAPSSENANSEKQTDEETSES